MLYSINKGKYVLHFGLKGDLADGMAVFGKQDTINGVQRAWSRGVLLQQPYYIPWDSIAYLCKSFHVDLCNIHRA